MEYVINPVKMGGLVKETVNGRIKVHLHGRLGVFTVPQKLAITQEPPEPGHEAEFYFSYIQIVENAYDYDSSELIRQAEPEPCLLGGTVIEVNDTAVKVAIMDDLGTVAVPRRWVFTSVPLEEGLSAEFYFSRMKIVGKPAIPAES